jgi:hypothetical protein
LSDSDHSFVRRLAVVACALLPAVALAQGAPSLSLPVACGLGRECVLQNYPDADPGPAARDYRCGRLSYDGHKGTDVRVIDAEALRRGVPVLAAASGRVRAVRDGMPDVSVRAKGREALAGRDAGNSVVIEHGLGWETQYAHLRAGSVAVRPGEVVERGRLLGHVGLSGNTEFHHLHFEVRYHGRAVDPFVGLAGGAECQARASPLWNPAALAALPYVATGLLGAGIAGAAPGLEAASVAHFEAFTPESPAIVFWVQIYGARRGDVEELRLLAPGGAVLVERRSPIERDLAQWYSYIGKPGAASAWPSGAYRGEYALYRGENSERLFSFAREVDLPGGTGQRPR